MDVNSTDPASIPPVKNNFSVNFFDWNYPSYYDVYCEGGTTIPGEKNYVIGSFYVGQYLVYLSLYVPSLIVISRPALFQHACYKIMFMIGLWDNVVGFVFTFLAGVFSFMGANYCDNNKLLNMVGHFAHIIWAVYCAMIVVLALNRCIEIYSTKHARLLFSGNRVWLWTIPICLYGFAFSTSTDLPVIYNSVYSVYFFQIDFRDGAPTVQNWLCLINSCLVITFLTVLYALLLLRLRSRTKTISVQNVESISSVQKKVMLQSFYICFSLYLIIIPYAIGIFVPVPKELAKFATIAVQMNSGFTSIVYILFNKSIRSGVKQLFIDRLQQHKSLTTNNGASKFASSVVATTNN